MITEWLFWQCLQTLPNISHTNWLVFSTVLLYNCNHNKYTAVIAITDYFDSSFCSSEEFLRPDHRVRNNSRPKDIFWRKTLFVRAYLNLHPRCKKRGGQELKQALLKNQMGSRCLLVLISLKILVMMNSLQNIVISVLKAS